MTDIKRHPEGRRPRKEATFELKSTSASGGRYVRALASVFNNVDLQGDRTMPGAFAKSLAKWAGSGKSIPVIFSHDWGNPFAHIGVVTSAKETDVGLEIEAELDVDENPTAKQVYNLMKKGTLSEWSFAYDVVEEQRQKDGSNELREVDLFEVGPTLKGANPLTTTLAVKSESTEDRTLRNHLDSNHALPVRAYYESAEELVVKHRLIHAELNTPVSERHLTTGIPDGDTAGANTTPKSYPGEEERVAERVAEIDRRFEKEELAFYNMVINEVGKLPQKAAPDRVDQFVQQVRAERAHEAVADTTAAAQAGSPTDLPVSAFAREERLAAKERQNDEVLGRGIDPLWQREEARARAEQERAEFIGSYEVPQP